MKVQLVDLDELYALKKGMVPWYKIPPPREEDVGIEERRKYEEAEMNRPLPQRKQQWPQKTKTGKMSIHRRKKFDPIREHLEWERRMSRGKFE